MKIDLKKGNIEEQKFLDTLSTWGTPIAGNMLGKIGVFIYRMINKIVDHPVFPILISPSLYKRGEEIKQSFEPTFDKKEEVLDAKTKKKITETKKVPINIYRPDEMRWLLAKERSLLKQFVKDYSFNKEIADFDLIPCHERSFEIYREFENKVKEYARQNSIVYFEVRRATRRRFNSLKLLRRKNNLSDQIDDRGFQAEELWSWMIQPEVLFKVSDDPRTRQELEVRVTEQYLRKVLAVAGILTNT
jgi:hypothetical protein